MALETEVNMMAPNDVPMRNVQPLEGKDEHGHDHGPAAYAEQTGQQTGYGAEGAVKKYCGYHIFSPDDNDESS